MTVRELEFAFELVRPGRCSVLTAMQLAASDGLPFIAVPVQTFVGTSSIATVAGDGGAPIKLKRWPDPAQ